MPPINEIDSSGVNQVLDEILVAREDEESGFKILKIGLSTVATGLALAVGTSALELQEQGNQFVFEMKAESAVIAIGSILVVAGTRMANDARDIIDRMVSNISHSRTSTSLDRPVSLARPSQGWKYSRNSLTRVRK